LAKEDLPRAPFFLFDLDKATKLEGENEARDFLAETFFSSFEQQRKEKENKMKSGASALLKHGDVKTNLKGLLGSGDSPTSEQAQKVIEYMKNLTPSGVELEILTLANFDFAEGVEPSEMIGRFFAVLERRVTDKQDSEYIQALLNCTLKTHNDVILEDRELLRRAGEVSDASEQVF